jgi:hypothetical protein
MRGAIPLLPQYVFMAWCLVKHRDSFILLYFKIKISKQNNTFLLLVESQHLIV